MSRLEQLKALHARDPGDPFLRYGIAMEHKGGGRLDEALAWLACTLEADPAYCYAYYQQGQIHESRGDTQAARAAYERGIAAAREARDAHAAAELEAALDLLAQ